MFIFSLKAIYFLNLIFFLFCTQLPPGQSFRQDVASWCDVRLSRVASHGTKTHLFAKSNCLLASVTLKLFGVSLTAFFSELSSCQN